MQGESDDLESLLTTYAACNRDLRDLLMSCPEERWYVPGPGGWSLADVLTHLADSEVVRGMRFRQIIAEDNPLLVVFDENRWREKLAYDKREPLDALGVYAAMLTSSCELLGAVGPEALDRFGRHPTEGKLTVRQLLFRGFQHAQEHIEQMRRIVADS